MFGVLLVVMGTFFDEISSSIGKEKVKSHEETVFTMSFLNSIWSVMGYILYSIFSRDFYFSLASLPTFSIRLVLEITLTYIATSAICSSDRSTFGFIRVLTIPLLLIVDLILGYALTFWQLAGIGVIMFTLFLTFTSHGIKKDGAGLCFISAVLAVATISLYKYDITHFNSVAAEQAFCLSGISGYLYFYSRYKKHENPIKFFKKPVFIMQSIFSGFASLVISLAYKFAPASVITTAVRSGSIFWSVASGGFYFKERHLFVKIISLALLCTGLIFLII